MALGTITTNTSWEFERDDLAAAVAAIPALQLTAGSTITAVTTIAQYVGQHAILATSALATVKICVGLRSAASAADTWQTVTTGA
jgi:hypothetical protein